MATLIYLDFAAFSAARYTRPPRESAQIILRAYAVHVHIRHQTRHGYVFVVGPFFSFSKGDEWRRAVSRLARERELPWARRGIRMIASHLQGFPPIEGMRANFDANPRTFEGTPAGILNLIEQRFDYAAAGNT